MLLKGLAAILLVASLSGCGGNGSTSSSAPSAPSTQVLMTGTWAGTASDSSGPGKMTWTVSQSGTSISGQVSASTSAGTVAFTGTLAGTLSGSNLSWTVTIPSGGVSVLPACTINMSGTAGVTATNVTGSYSGTNSCNSPFTNGSISLTKQ